MRIFLILTLLFFISSCYNKKLAMFLPNTAMTEFQDALQNAPPEFKQGWYDGCSVGSSAGGNKFYKTLYDSASVDGYKYINSAEYKTAWGNAFWYCYRYTFVKNKSSVWGSIFSGYR